MTTTTLSNTLERLAAFEPNGSPVLSVYLDARADQHGRDSYEPFLRKALKQRIQTFPPRTAERESVEHDAERVRRYLANDVEPSANGIAIFASHGNADFFEALQLDAPVTEHALFVGQTPHLYPLARLSDRYRPYAALVADTNRARIYVFGLGRTLVHSEITSDKESRTEAGGWSQARYQRHIDDFRAQHAKEVVERLDAIVRNEGIEHVLVAGDEVILPMLRQHMPEALAARVQEVLRLDISSPEHQVMKETLEAFQALDARTDAEKVQRLFDEHRAGGLAVAGAHETMNALIVGQVDELLISGNLTGVDVLEARHDLAQDPDEAHEPITVDGLVRSAAQTSARTTVIEDPSLLERVGGVGGLLRWKA